MGDFVPPARGTAGGGCVQGAEYERLRRRFERYRQLHANRQQQYDSFATNVYNQQVHETQLLRKKWLETVGCKKPSSATAHKSAAGKGLQQRADGGPLALPTTQQQPQQQPFVTVTQKKFKRTANGQFKSASAESPPPSVPPVSSSIAAGQQSVPDGGTAMFSAGFEDSGAGHHAANAMNGQPQVGGNAMPNSGSGNPSAVHNSVSVNINVDANLHRSQSAIKLTFSSTINGHTTQQQQSLNPTPPAAAAGSEFCKTEQPTTGSDCSLAGGPTLKQQNGPPTAQGSSMGSFASTELVEDFDELSEFLDKFDTTEGPDGLPQDILKILDEGVGGLDGPDFAADGLMHPAASNASGGRDPAAMPGMLPRYPPGSSGPVAYPSGMAPMAAGGMTPYGPLASSAKMADPSCLGIMPPPTAATLLGDTGPAAETLKQMAAQHQNQANRQYNASVGYGDRFHPSPLSAAAAAGGGGASRLPRYPNQAQYVGGYAMPSSMYQCDNGRYGGYSAMDSAAAAAMSAGNGNNMGRPVPMDQSRFMFPSSGVHGSNAQTPTSLQRLESQVQSHFAPGCGSQPGVDIPTTAQIRMKQSQRIDMRGSQLTVGQQQSFTVTMDGGVQGPTGPAGSSQRYPMGYQYPGTVTPTGGMRMMPTGYQNMTPSQTGAGSGLMHPVSAANAMMPAGRQPQSVSTGDQAAMVQSVRMPVPAGNMNIPGGVSGGAVRPVSGHGSPLVVGPTVQPKIESTLAGYPMTAAEQAMSRDVKGTIGPNLPHAAIKNSSLQCPPYVAGTGTVDNYQQMGKWMQQGGVGPHMAPMGSSNMRSPFPVSYTGLPESTMGQGHTVPVQMMHPGVSGMGPVEFQNCPRWTVSMSQSQSMFISGSGPVPAVQAAADPSVCHPGTMMDGGGVGYNRSMQHQQPHHVSGYGPTSAGIYGPGIMASAGPNGDQLVRPPGDFIHRGVPMNNSGSSALDYETFAGGGRGQMVVPEYACIDDVFIGSKQ